jgi:hypothetical protein
LAYFGTSTNRLTPTARDDIDTDPNSSWWHQRLLLAYQWQCNCSNSENGL